MEEWEKQTAPAHRRAGLAVVALAAVAITATAVGGLVISRPRALLQLPRRAHLEGARISGAPTSKLEYFANLGYKNAEKCDGSIPTAQQSPVAIELGGVGDIGNVVLERLPPVGLKTPGTNEVRGEPDVKAFVSGNKFDMSEAGVHITYGGAEYVLDHFVLKTPSEHTINGEEFGMEQQFVHFPENAASYKALIVSVMYKENPLNSPEFIQQLYHAIPCMSEGKHCQRAISFASMARSILYQTPSKFGRLTYAFDPTEVVADLCIRPPCVYGGAMGDSVVSLWVPQHARANFRDFFRYEGSRTTPPCQENVQWLVLRNPVPIQSDHLAAFQLVLGDIARPTQPLNGRVIEEASRF